MIADRVLGLYRADILRCKAQALELQAEFLRLGYDAEAQEMAGIALKYSDMMEPSEKQKTYWDIISNLLSSPHQWTK